MSYTYCCPVCGYCGNNPQYFRAKVHADGHTCQPIHINDREKYGLKESDFSGL